MLLHIPNSLPPSQADPDESEPNVHHPPTASQANVPASLPLVGRKSVLQLELTMKILGEAAPNTCRIGLNY